MRYWNRLFRSLLLAVALTPVQALAAQQVPGIPSVEGGKWLIRLVRFERSGADFGDYTFTFNAQNRENGKRTALQLQNETTAIDKIEVSGDVLVVFGSAETAANVVSLFNLNSGEKLNTVLCWWPHLSSGGRYIATVKFFPRFADPALTSHVVVLYDLQRSVLRPIFPEENAQSGKADSWIEKEADRHAIDPRAGFLWGPKEDRVIFVDHFRGDTWLISVVLTEGRAEVRRIPLDVASILALPKSDPAYAETVRREREGLAVEGLRWAGEDVVAVQLDRSLWASQGLFRESSLRVKVGAPH
jgi:hypothetical protein